MDETSYQDIEQATIEILDADQATIHIDAQCLFGSAFGSHCANGGGAEVTDARTFISVDTAPIADALDGATICVCVTVLAVAFLRLFGKPRAV